jgi:hypothetical protein
LRSQLLRDIIEIQTAPIRALGIERVAAADSWLEAFCSHVATVFGIDQDALLAAARQHPREERGQWGEMAVAQTTDEAVGVLARWNDSEPEEYQQYADIGRMLEDSCRWIHAHPYPGVAMPRLGVAEEFDD